MRWICLIVAAVLILEGCISYSKQKRVPGSKTVTTRLAPGQKTTQSGKITIESYPTQANPQAPLGIAAFLRTEGPEEEVTAFKIEERRRKWSPAYIPLGLLELVAWPMELFMLMDYKHSLTYDLKVHGCPSLFGITFYHLAGIQPKANPDPYNRYMTYCRPTIETAEETRLTGKTTEEIVPHSGASIQVVLSAQSASGQYLEEISQSFSAKEGQGKIKVDMAPLIRQFPERPENVIVQASLADVPEASAKWEVDPGISEMLYRPVETEKKGDQAAQAGDYDKALARYASALQMTPAGAEREQRLRKKAIELALSMDPSPEIPEDAKRRMVRSQAFIERADFNSAASELKEATKTAPWWPTAYFNLGIAQEKAEDFAGAIKSFQLYLLSAPNAEDAGAVQKRIYKLEVSKETAEGKSN